MSLLSIQRVLALPATVAPSTLYIVRSANAPFAELFFTNNDATDTRRLLNTADVQTMITDAVAAIPGGGGNSATADALSIARTISATGDATWSVSFDGSANATSVLTLKDTGIAAGEHFVVTFDAQGRAVSSRALVVADIPDLPGTKITSDLTVNTSGNAATATKLATARLINGVAFDGTADITINSTDATARIAESEKGVANGVATLGADGKIPSGQLPGYVDDVLEFANLAALPATGDSGKLYVTADTNLIYRWTGTQYIGINSGAGVADSAVKLATARTISVTGDATWTTSFDGTADVSAALTLADTGIVAGEYAVTTVDSKGRATAGRALVAADIPSLDHTTVTSAASINLAASEW